MCVGGKGVAHTGWNSGWKLLIGKIPVVEIPMSRFQPFTCTQNTVSLRQPGGWEDAGFKIISRVCVF